MWSLSLGIRYFFSKRKEGMISLIGGISVLGVAVGIASLIVVLSIMNGFDLEVKKKIVDTYAHLTVLSEGGIENSDELMARLVAVEGIESASPFFNGQAILKNRGSVTGILLRGIHPRKDPATLEMIRFASPEGAGSGLGEGNIVLGSELMADQRISPGDTVELLVPYSALDMEKTELTVTGAFTSGRYDYDANMALVGLGTARKIFRVEDSVGGIALRAGDQADVNELKGRIQAMLGYPYIVRSWMDLDKNLVSALAMEKKMMFIILTLIVLVACFNISSSLIMMVMEKTRDIGILKALGANVRGISTVFMVQGALVGAVGIVLGTVSGVFIAGRINEIAAFIERAFDVEMFPSDIYYFTEIPVNVSTQDICAVMTVAFVLSVAAGFYPAWKAARLDPVRAIRYE
ncbi:MAG: FtsX-like permease family protein [Candidatus Omnitrophica bacterium]|nr:FtsX-like permease family protein [Candidatus Omnitrophota bacterium]